jgi:hypothetical protein
MHGNLENVENGILTPCSAISTPLAREIPVKSGQGVILSRSNYLLLDRLAIRELEGVW